MLDIKLLQSPHPFASNTYLISSDGEYAIIDPTCPYDESLIDGKVLYILLTHAHFDHILEVDSWVKATGARVFIGVNDVEALSDPMRNCFKLYNGTDNGYFGDASGVKEGDKIPLGNTDITIIECPGHTIGSVSYLCQSCVFVGDTVFAGGGFGRYDLPTGNRVLLIKSIDKLINLPLDTVFYPGHGESTTNKKYRLDIGR